MPGSYFKASKFPKPVLNFYVANKIFLLSISHGLQVHLKAAKVLIDFEKNNPFRKIFKLKTPPLSLP